MPPEGRPQSIPAGSAGAEGMKDAPSPGKTMQQPWAQVEKAQPRAQGWPQSLPSARQGASPDPVASLPDPTVPGGQDWSPRARQQAVPPLPRGGGIPPPQVKRRAGLCHQR